MIIKLWAQLIIFFIFVHCFKNMSVKYKVREILFDPSISED